MFIYITLPHKRVAGVTTTVSKTITVGPILQVYYKYTITLT
jgi:hypothetical protein